jgi:hypothetical protein
MFALRAPLPIPRVPFTYKKCKISRVCKSYYTIDEHNSKPLDKAQTSGLLHVLTFHKADAEEGIYSVRKLNNEGVPVDWILAFTTFEDAFRFKTLLDAEMNLSPYVQFASRFELEHACNVTGCKCRVVNEGTLVTPPTETMKITDWERRSALLNGRWSVKEKSDEPPTWP